METETLGTSQESQADNLRKQWLLEGSTKAGKLTHAYFAATDEKFRKWCEDNNFEPTKTRARKYRNKVLKTKVRSL